MSFSSSIFFCLIVTATASDANAIKNPRTSRFITLNSASNDIEISLDFSIPFIKIPLKKSFNLGSGPDLGLPKINFDPSSLAFGGVMVLVTSLLASVFNGKGSPPNHPYHDGHRFGRNEDSDFTTGAFMDIASTIISNSHSCPSKLACWASRNSNNESLEIWKQIISNRLLTTIFNTTAVEYAFVAGKNGVDCESFAPCPLEEEQFTRLKNLNIPHTVDSHQRRSTREGFETHRRKLTKHV